MHQGTNGASGESSTLNKSKRRISAWGWVLAWLGLIYATAPVVQNWVRRGDLCFSRVWYAVIVGAILLLVGLWITWHLIRPRASSKSPSFFVMLVFMALAAATVAAFYLIPGAVPKAHLVLYGFLSLLVFRAVSIDVDDWTCYPTSLVLCVIGGLGDELIQGYAFGRTGELFDIKVNLCASTLGLGYLWLYRYPTPLQRCVARGSVQWLCRSLIAAVLFVALFVTINPDVRFGYLHKTGAYYFYSVLTLDELKSEDEKNADEWARELSPWYDAQIGDVEASFAEAARDGQIDEPTRMLFSQVYRHFFYRNELLQHYEVERAWIENTVGDHLNNYLLSRTAPGWQPGNYARMAQHLEGNNPTAPYVSSFVPSGTPVYMVTGRDGMWSAHSMIPERELRRILIDHRDDYIKLSSRVYISAYLRFLRQYPMKQAPFLREMRVHLYRRYRCAIQAKYDVAYCENLILEKHFGNTLSKTPFAWPAGTAERMLAGLLAIDPDFKSKEYVSKVGDNYIHRVKLHHCWLIALAVAGLLQLFSRTILRRL
jgi:hypothetical protein